jgi:hypothetical protein
MIDGGDEVASVPETEGAMADQLDLVVHALDGSVGEAHASPGQDSLQMRPQHNGDQNLM